jgi:effector-binding domain-containing protein
MDAIGAAMGPLYGELFGWLGQKGIRPAGAPWVRYLVVGAEECELEAGSPLTAEVSGEGRVIAGIMPACTVVSTLHVGPYSELVGAYSALAAWMTTNGAVAAGAMWEVYLTDPQSEPDSAKWQTLVYCPVADA